MFSMTGIRENPIHGLFLSLGLFAFLAGSAKADVVVLRTGTEIQGTVANREQVATSPGLFSNISILIEREGLEASIQRIAVADILYVLLEDNSSKRVIDFSDFQQVRRVPESERLIGPEFGANPVTMSIVGAGLCAFGILVKFGGEKLTVTASDVKYEENSYNALNYVHIVGGGILFIVGIAMSSGRSEEARPGNTLLSFDHQSKAVQLGYRIQY